MGLDQTWFPPSEPLPQTPSPLNKHSGLAIVVDLDQTLFHLPELLPFIHLPSSTHFDQADVSLHQIDQS